MTKLLQHYLPTYWAEICGVATKGGYEVAVVDPPPRGGGAAEGRGKSWRLDAEAETLLPLRPARAGHSRKKGDFPGSSGNIMSQD